MKGPSPRRQGHASSSWPPPAVLFRILFAAIAVVCCTHWSDLPVGPCIVVAAPANATVGEPSYSNKNVTAAAAEESDYKSRVAHCLVGQRRTMDHPMVHQNYEAHVLSKLGAPSDIYFVLDGTTDATSAYRPTATDFVQVQGMYHQYKRWFRCMEMIQEHEKTSGTNYSHVVINRADQVVLQDIPSIDAFPQKSIWVKPYGEDMDDYLPIYSYRDEDAELPTGSDYGIADLFLIIPRHLAPDYLDEIRSIYEATITEPRAKLDKMSCGDDMDTKKLCGSRRSHSECILKCAMYGRKIPVAYQNFQLRLLRPHQKGGCKKYMREGAPGKHYNSLCM